MFKISTAQTLFNKEACSNADRYEADERRVLNARCALLALVPADAQPLEQHPNSWQFQH